MNISGWKRGMMAKSMGVEDYFNHVMGCVERELEEAGHDLILISSWPGKNERDVAITLILNGRVLNLGISQSEVERRKEESPFSLDWLIWSELIRLGVEVQDSGYMKALFTKNSKKDGKSEGENK
ncbi:hypothetical protein MM300_21540 [Evansella sp. LMS18]|jgi:hypothetical protein|uniref:hypothetical protein n=1 Tax=Evansella sp. LMS18 TaxID=2924033 RepID=UPI0020D0F00C|nr:hypothetical protein [Evansella sp. LMS18]UTR10419.1 hypothetical protein MM300_21540 [Evansella sp. LMS18]